MTQAAVADNRGRRFLPVGPFALYTLVYAALLPSCWFAISPDSISYLSIARHYVDRHWSEAINSYWGPATSWIIAALMAVGLPDLAAAHAAMWLYGLAMLYAFHRLTGTFELRPGLRMAAGFTAALLCAAFALSITGPDLLLAAVLIYYFHLIFDRDYPLKPRAGLLCGLAGAAAYLIKSFGLYFFVASFLLLNMLHLRHRSSHRRRILMQTAIGLAVALACSAPWIAAISAQAGRFTLGTTGDWNYRLVGPDSPGYPQYGRLLAPGHPHAVSMWEAPPPVLPRWSPWSSARNLWHQVKLTVNNAKSFYRDLLLFSLLSFAILLAWVARGLSSPYGKVRWEYPALMFALLPGPYLLVTIQDRYLWALDFLLLAMAAAVIQVVEPFLRKTGQWVLAAGVCGSFMAAPLFGLISLRHAGEAIHHASVELRDRFGVHGRLASCGEWNNTLALAYFSGNPYYGSTDRTAAEEEAVRQMRPETAPPPQMIQANSVQEQLSTNGVDYYVGWPTCRLLDPVITGMPEVTHGAIPGLRIFRVR